MQFIIVSEKTFDQSAFPEVSILTMAPRMLVIESALTPPIKKFPSADFEEEK